ncbi:polysaccharide deacetylase family protein [Tautonia sociabilis]|uniref:Dehydrogenase n=1 Tax=Tautonia sociabilis TaxID=2080755 RepID=A0A432MFR7_9BACT|nr:polysaccharide deacetylase family protein [Tautonia sociabilis]RUL85006.1 hypothetical protein TsocGM_19380 [Tautonia sociabilis]
MLAAALLTALCLSPPQEAPAPTPAGAASTAAKGNRLTYLDGMSPYDVGRSFPKLTTPQWIGEEGVDAVVILAIDDLRDNTPKYEGYLRPILDHLKKIEGRAPVSIMTNRVDPESPQVADWLAEGISMEVHTLDHPCPLLAGGDFEKAARTYHDGVDLLRRIPGNTPVAFRMPCCDSMNSPSPRFYREIFEERSGEQHFLTIDSSVCVVLTPDDPDLPRGLVVDPDGTPRFRKYLPSEGFVNWVEDYPYPYLINRLCWEFPCMVPSDWEAQNHHGENNPKTIEDWKRALDATVIKQGVFTMVFHPHGWIEPEQVVEFIDYASKTYGNRVRFLNFREAQERLDANLLGGQPVRDRFGRDNGVRLIDLDNDGYLDVLLGDGGPRVTRIWKPAGRRWELRPMPTSLIMHEGAEHPTAVRFAVLDPDGSPAMIGGEGPVKHCWIFDGNRWVLQDARLRGLPVDVDGLRFRDLDGDGICEAILTNRDRGLTDTSGAYRWAPSDSSWEKLPFLLPAGAWTSGFQGLDSGLRFLDLDGDGLVNDLFFSDDERFGAFVFTGLDSGWSRPLRAGRADAPDAFRPVVRRFGEENGFFAKGGVLYWQNEDTGDLPNQVDRLPIEALHESPDN